MAKENLQRNSLNVKVVIFWSMILLITVLFAVLFAIKIHDTKIFDSYEDINRAKLNLVYDITSEEGTYYVYVYSAKESNGILVDTNKTDITKANEVLPTVFNYFNYVRRNERTLGNNEDFYRIYAYNVKSARDSNLEKLNLNLDQLPALVRVNGDEDGIDEIITSANGIQRELSDLMNNKK